MYAGPPLIVERYWVDKFFSVFGSRDAVGRDDLLFFVKWDHNQVYTANEHS